MRAKLKSHMLRYSIPPDRISLRLFFDLCKKRKMLPGRVLLQENMDERLALLSNSGIRNLADILSSLSSKQKLQEIALISGLDPAYLTLLKREAGSYLAKPFPLSNFPGIPYEYTELLKSKGIGNTRTCFERIQTPAQRKDLSRNTGIPEERLKELFVLCDLSRIRGVGGARARMAYEAGIRSTAEFAVTKEHFKMLIAEDDIPYCIDYAKVITAMDQIDT